MYAIRINTDLIITFEALKFYNFDRQARQMGGLCTRMSNL